MMLPFLAALLALLIVAMWKRQNATGTALVLLVNWTLLTSFWWITDERFPWPLFVVVDYLSALVVYAIRTSKWQSAIIGIYAAQIICHAAFGLSSQNRAAEDTYWWTLTLTGWAQLAALGGWMIAGLAGRTNRIGSGASPAFIADGSCRSKAGEP